MYRNFYKRFNTRKLLLSFTMALITQVWHTFLFGQQSFYVFLGIYSPVSAFAVFPMLTILLVIVYQHIYSSRFEWFLYTPVWLAVSLITKIPINGTRSLINPVAYKSTIIPIAIKYLLDVFIELFIWSVLMTVAGLIVHAIRKGYISRKLNVAYSVTKDDTDKESTRKPVSLWRRLSFSVIDASIMAVPVLMLVLNPLRTIYDSLAIKNKAMEYRFLAILLLLCAMLTIFYTAVRILLSLLIHRSYKSYLASLPFYVLSGVAVWLTAPSDFSGWQYCAPIVWTFYSDVFPEDFYSIVLSKWFFSAAYILQWFIVISLIFAVKAFIRYCNRQFVKESLEGKGSI